MHLRPRVLSIVESYLGHRTYGDLMKTYFSQSFGSQTEVNWYNSDRDLKTRIINRLLSFQFPNAWIQAQNLDLHWLRIQLGFSYMAKQLALRKLNGTAAQPNYSVLHFHTQILALTALDLMKLLPTVVSLDMTAAQASRIKTNSALRWTYNPNLSLEKKVYETAAAVVTFSEAARRSVINDYDIDVDKVKVIYPGVDVSRITPVSQELIPRSPSSHQPYRILFVGGDFERKGGHDLLAVFLEQFTEQAELHLVTQAAIDCSHPRVQIHSNISAYTPEWLALYHQADVFVMPTYAEPFGWVFIEAMAAGLPVIASQLNAIPEMVAQAETGFLVQPGDRVALAHAIQALIDYPELGHAMGMRGRQVVESRFDANKNFQTLESLFQSVSILSPKSSLCSALSV